jgi:mono/diheme cytochrome c family protein
VTRPARKRPAAVLAVALVPVVGALLAGCASQNTDVARGRQLFIQNCGTCHTLAQAATAGVQGPNLDAAFAEARASGMDHDTIAGVVKAQIEDPRPSTPDPSVSMPRDLVTGQDAQDVAAYVGDVAGVPGIQPPKAPGGPGGQVFADNGCAGCHTLKAANASGTLGPNLDEAIPKLSAAEIKQSIVDPGAKITPGYPNAMPATFGQTISPQDLTLLIKFLMTSAGGK